MISLLLDKEKYMKGDKVNLKIILNLEKPINVRGVYASLLCHEKKKIVLVREMDHYDYNEEKSLGLLRSTNIKKTVDYRDDIIYREDKVVAPAGIYFKEEFLINFYIPHNAPPTSKEYGHDNKINFWELEAKLDIPLAFDKRAIKEIFVEGL